jgi:hypothetical protein
MAMHRFTNPGPVVRLFVAGILFLKGRSTIVTGSVRTIKACQDAGLTDVVA